MVHAEDLAAIKGHIGPVYGLDFNDTGMCFASGGEEGTVRIAYFDEEYFKSIAF